MTVRGDPTPILGPKMGLGPKVGWLPARAMRARLDWVRLARVLILAGYGIFILSLFLRHALTLYINPSYVWPTTAAGVTLVALAVARVIRKPAHSEGDAETCDCGEACSREPVRRPRSLAALAFPLLLALAVPIHSLSAFSALQRGPQVAGVASIPGTAHLQHVSLSVDTRTYKLMDWVGALSADPNPKDYLGKPVIITGMVLHSPASVPPGYVMVMRYLVWCCIADARPVGLIVRDSSHGTLKDGQWVKVTGRMGETTYQQQQMAVVEPTQLVPVKAGNPYMY